MGSAETGGRSCDEGSYVALRVMCFSVHKFIRFNDDKFGVYLSRMVGMHARSFACGQFTTAHCAAVAAVVVGRCGCLRLRFVFCFYFKLEHQPPPR